MTLSFQSRRTPPNAGELRPLSRPQLPPARGRAGSSWYERAFPYFLVLPVLILIGVFVAWPLFYSVYLSLVKWNFVSPSRLFVGLQNYGSLWVDPDFWNAARNTVLYATVLIPVLVLGALVLAVTLARVRDRRLQSLYQAVIFVPTVLSFSSASVMWLWIFNPADGVLNKFATLFGQPSQMWLNDPHIAFWCVVVVVTWKLIGLNVLLFSMALHSVPQDCLEAAALDGASGWALFFHIRLPLISPTFFFVLVTTTIFVAEDSFDAISILTRGGPYGQTTNLFYFLYDRGLLKFDVGSASAVALIVFLAIVAITWLQFRFVERKVHYV